MFEKILDFLNKHVHMLFISAFFILSTLFLFLFCYENLTGIPTKSVQIWENRALAKFPSLKDTSLTTLPNKLESYLVDNLPLRTQVIRSYRRMWADCLPPLLNPIIKGKDGHQFSRMTILNYMGRNPLSTSSLRYKKLLILGLDRFWRYHNAEFLSFFVPDKPVVYCNYLDEWVGDSRGWQAQISSYLSDLKSYGVRFYDLTEILQKKSDTRLLFNKASDLLHWNGNALDILYNLIKSELRENPNFTPNEEVRPFSLELKEMETALGKKENVPWMILNNDGVKIVQQDFNIDVTDWRAVDIVQNDKVTNGTILFTTDSCIKKTHQDFIKDSHGAIFPTIHNAHRQIMTHYEYSGYDFYLDLVKKTHPNIVIDEFVEWVGLPGYNDANKIFYLVGSAVSEEKKVIIDKDLISNSDIDSTSKGDVAYIDSNSMPVAIEASTSRTDSEGFLAVIAKIVSPTDTTVTIEYSPNNDKSIRRERTATLKSGVDYLYVQLHSEPNQLLDITVKLAGVDGEYAICTFPNEFEEFFKEDMNGL